MSRMYELISPFFSLSAVACDSDLVQLLMDAYVYENELESTSYDKLTISAENGTLLVCDPVPILSPLNSG